MYETRSHPFYCTIFEKNFSMTFNIYIHSDNALDTDEFIGELDIALEVLMEIGGEDGGSSILFACPGESTTMFMLASDGHGEYAVGISGLASMHDYRLLPYLADCLNVHLNGEGLRVDGRSVYEVYGEQWAEESIGEAVAQLKVGLMQLPRFYVMPALTGGTYVSLEFLRRYGVTLHSSTPRIYGYVQYILANGLAPVATDEEIEEDFRNMKCCGEVDVPQHESIGRVKSWQTDGCETWESFSHDDVEALLEVGEAYRRGNGAEGVVLNDLGTIYQEGIGVERDGRKAEYWFGEACRMGDRTYAPSNLGDLYRKGCGSLAPSAVKAMEAYSMGDDPYAHYRMGQAYEEGWSGVRDMAKAMEWYARAAGEGHHLAVKRMRMENAGGAERQDAANC